MSFTVEESRTYPYSNAVVLEAALGAIEGLEGKLQAQEEKGAQTEVSAKFHKTILGKVLGDRTHLDAVLREETAGETTLDLSIYPLDAIGRKLQFGARKGVSRTVAQWFFAHLEHRLPK